MEMSEHTKDLFSALAKAQAEMKQAIKDSVNPHFRSSYADLTSVWDACREPLSKNGLSVSQFLESDPDGVKMTTILGHSSGQWLRASAFIPVTKKDPQGYGSAITYLRRYSLAAAVGITQDDDDGNVEMPKAPPAKTQAPQPAAPKATQPKPAAKPVQQPAGADPFSF